MGVPDDVHITIDPDHIPFTEGNDIIWHNGNIQHPDADIEINCWDSSYTIIKFKEKKLSDKFRDHFPEAVELEKFK